MTEPNIESGAVEEERVMELRRKAQVGPFVYTIMRDLAADGDGAWGMIRHIDRTIHIGRVCLPKQLPITFLHELIHAVENAYGMDLEENDTIRLANGLAQALQSVGLLPQELVLEGEDV